MELLKLIEALRQFDPATVVPVGFGNPHSYRGDYAGLAFEPVADTTVGAMLDSALLALGATYQGYKGGDYTMGEYTDCHLAYRGEAGAELGAVLVSYMVGAPRMPGPWDSWADAESSRAHDMTVR